MVDFENGSGYEWPIDYSYLNGSTNTGQTSSVANCKKIGPGFDSDIISGI